MKKFVAALLVGVVLAVPAHAGIRIGGGFRPSFRVPIIPRVSPIKPYTPPRISPVKPSIVKPVEPTAPRVAPRPAPSVEPSLRVIPRQEMSQPSNSYLPSWFWFWWMSRSNPPAPPAIAPSAGVDKPACDPTPEIPCPEDSEEE